MNKNYQRATHKVIILNKEKESELSLMHEDKFKVQNLKDIIKQYLLRDQSL